MQHVSLNGLLLGAACNGVLGAGAEVAHHG